MCLGLDRYYIDTEETNKEQERVLRALLRIATSADIPVILHSRKAERRVFELLLEEGVKKAVFHCFGGKMKLAKEIAHAGYFLSIPCGAIVDTPSNQFRKMVDLVPIERLLSETDSPYLGPEKGLRNDPRSVRRGIAIMATVKRIGEEEMRDTIRANFRTLFGL